MSEILNRSWDSFFLCEKTVSDDFTEEREIAFQSEREEL